MDKGLGFSRTILMDWLDVTASLRSENVDPSEIRQRLTTTISGVVNGVEAQRKTIDVLSAIWVKTGTTVPIIHKEALAMFPTLNSSEERLWLHYGLTLVSYPIFWRCVGAIGQAGRTKEFITRRSIKERLSGEYGHFGSLDRSVERIMASLTDWGALERTEGKKEYCIVTRKFRSSEALQSWLLTCALQAHPSDAIPFNDLVRLPELYPFNFTIGIEDLRSDQRFVVQRQGGRLDMVGINLLEKKCM